MLPIDGAWDAILLGCFVFGLVLSVVLLVVGDLGLGVDAGDGGHHGGVGEGLPLNLSSVIAFVAWFGGVGYLALNGAGWPIAASLAVGAAAGVVGALAVAWVMSRLVAAPGSVLDAKDYRMPGVIARVTSSIRAGGVGEIVYEQGGVRQVAAARTGDGEALGRGTEVVVLGLRNGTATVQAASVFFEEAGVPVGENGSASRGNESRRRALT